MRLVLLLLTALCLSACDNTTTQPAGNPGILLATMNRNITSLVIPESVTEIDSYAFANFLELTSVTIGTNVFRIESVAFANCIKLTSITYQGTTAQWSSVEKRDLWNHGSSFSVICTDGTV